MTHPLLEIADKEKLHNDSLSRKLNPAKVARATSRDGTLKLSDGGGLYLHIKPKPNGAGKPSKVWRYKYRIDKREGLLAIGVMPEIGLADARKIHRAARWLVERKIHPTQYVREENARREAEQLRRNKGALTAVCEKWLERDRAKLAPGSMA